MRERIEALVDAVTIEWEQYGACRPIHGVAVRDARFDIELASFMANDMLQGLVECKIASAKAPDRYLEVVIPDGYESTKALVTCTWLDDFTSSIERLFSLHKVAKFATYWAWRRIRGRISSLSHRKFNEIKYKTIRIDADVIVGAIGHDIIGDIPRFASEIMVKSGGRDLEIGEKDHFFGGHAECVHDQRKKGQFAHFAENEIMELDYALARNGNGSNDDLRRKLRTMLR